MEICHKLHIAIYRNRFIGISAISSCQSPCGQDGSKMGDTWELEWAKCGASCQQASWFQEKRMSNETRIHCPNYGSDQTQKKCLFMQLLKSCPLEAQTCIGQINSCSLAKINEQCALIFCSILYIAILHKEFH